MAIKKANELEEHANFYSMMALSHHHLQEHEQAVIAMGHALELDPNEIKGNLAVVATAYSLMSLERIEHAEELLYRHQLAVTDSTDGPVFIKAVLYLRKKKAAVEAVN